MLLTEDDLATLKPGTWLNDQVITLNDNFVQLLTALVMLQLFMFQKYMKI